MTICNKNRFAIPGTAMIPNFPVKRKDYFVNGIRPDVNDNYQIDAYLTSEEFDTLKANPTDAIPGMTYFDTELGRVGFCYLKNNLKYFVPIATGGGEGGTSDYRLLSNKPAINSVELAGNKTAVELGLVTTESLELKADKILVANVWNYTLENIEDMPVADGDVFQISTGNEDIPELILYVSQVDGIDLWSISPESGSAELYLTDITATKVDGIGVTETLTVSVSSAPVYIDLSDVQNNLISESAVRANADELIRQEFNAYRSAADQDDIDNEIKSDKVSKSAFTNTTINPNGFVLLWLQPDFQADAVNISYGAMQPITGQFTPGNVALPFANVNAAGIMAKEDKQALDDLTERLSFVEQGITTERFVDTKADLLAVDTTNMPDWTPYIVRSDSDHANATTKYYYNPTGTNPTANGFIFGIVVQEVPYTVATASMLGLVISSELDGKVQVEGTGAMSVNGWDALKSRTSTLETTATLQVSFNLNHDHSGGANGAVLPPAFTVFATEAEAAADTSGKMALYPL